MQSDTIHLRKQKNASHQAMMKPESKNYDARRECATTARYRREVDSELSRVLVARVLLGSLDVALHVRA